MFWFKKYLHCFLNSLFPRNFTCDFCGEEISSENKIAICNKCQNELPFITNPCKKCGQELKGNKCYACFYEERKFTQAIAPFRYNGKIRSALLNFKYNQKNFYKTTFAYYMAMCFLKSKINVDACLCVPMFDKKQKKRGYNQSEELLKETNKYLQLEDISSSIIKTQNTITQTTLNSNDRKNSIKDAYKVVEKSKIKDKKILIIDDVFTTGATISVISELLIKAGAKQVFALTLCHNDNLDLLNE